jgi:hypothetical protein
MRGRALLWVGGWLLLAVLACTSNDTLIIHLTETPTPKPSPTPLAVHTRFRKGDQLTFVAAELSVLLSTRPGSTNALDTSKTPCFRDSKVVVLDYARSEVDPNDPTIYYQVKCVSTSGWVPEYRLTAFNRGQKAGIRATVVVWKVPDSTKATATDPTCPAGSTVTIDGFTMNPQRKDDKTLYVQIECQQHVGYTLESALVSDEEF